MTRSGPRVLVVDDEQAIRLDIGGSQHRIEQMLFGRFILRFLAAKGQITAEYKASRPVSAGSFNVYGRGAKDVPGIFKFYAQCILEKNIFSIIMGSKMLKGLFCIDYGIQGKCR